MPEIITLSEKLEQSLKELADTQGKTLNQLLEEALNLYLAWAVVKLQIYRKELMNFYGKIKFSYC